METFKIHIDNKELSKELRTYLKSKKIKFETSKISVETKQISDSITQGYKESLDIEAGKIKPKTIESFLDEL